MRLKTELVTKESHIIEAVVTGANISLSHAFANPEIILHLEDENGVEFCLAVSNDFYKQYLTGMMGRIKLTVEHTL